MHDISENVVKLNQEIGMLAREVRVTFAPNVDSIRSHAQEIIANAQLIIDTCNQVRTENGMEIEG